MSDTRYLSAETRAKLERAEREHAGIELGMAASLALSLDQVLSSRIAELEAENKRLLRDYREMRADALTLGRALLGAKAKAKEAAEE